MDETLAKSVASALGERPIRLEPLTGGCVGEVYRVVLRNDSVVAKFDRSERASLEVEGKMLRYLQANSRLPVPEVRVATPGLLVMDEIINDGSRSDKGERDLGTHVAALHTIGGENYGFEYSTLIGGLPQPNPPRSDWPRFFAEHRVLEFAERAARANAIDRQGVDRLERLAFALPELLGDGPGPRLIHGDIWSGNVLWNQGRLAAFIDPAIYYADPEVELAFIDLFSTFGPTAWAAYREVHPERNGWRARRKAYQIYPLLVHAVLFGGAYGASALREANDLGF
ncbi:MAG: fructosamine kinase family protein [Planctomycetota bacterium]